jgi:hypothetical protein
VLDPRLQKVSREYQAAVHKLEGVFVAAKQLHQPHFVAKVLPAIVIHFRLFRFYADHTEHTEHPEHPEYDLQFVKD